MVDLQNLRENILEKPLDINELKEKVPEKILENWIKDSIEAGVTQPNSMTLSTVDRENKPHTRVVLLKEILKQSLVFFSNYESPKAIDIAHNNNVAVNFHWMELGRQVRVEGVAEKVSRDYSEHYFRSRPLESQIAAVISKQGQIVSSRDQLEAEYQELEKKSKASGQEISCPKNWGGFVIYPYYYEFWQNRSNRLHDRIFFKREDKSWVTGRLYP